ncbi:tumor protein p53-inducible nuclear protein 2 [Marmota marmota marmota]|uniref:tumor protein p53-inducible nuclear protein 2 n=1 Tax=Marmota marmota marmota TaxID=9994 RepID=UPI0007625E50|nr:tumor protein p53-inducible nuclear protein 2 [Marmota marmota marmota]
MFQRLTSLFFSTPSPPEDSDCPHAFVSQEDEVDGWLIIDLPDSYESSPSPGAASAPAGRPPPAPSLMDESWFVTPPACFTAEGPGLGPTVLLEKAGQVRRLQRARQRAERYALSAKAVQRQNRARESRPRRPKHQGSFIYQPCQRQFNY